MLYKKVQSLINKAEDEPIKMNLQFFADGDNNDTDDDQDDDQDDDEDDEGENNDDDEDEGEKEKKKDGKVMTQRQLDRMAVKTKKKAQGNILKMFNLPNNEEGLKRLEQMSAALTGTVATGDNDSGATMLTQSKDMDQIRDLASAQIEAELMRNNIDMKHLDHAAKLILADIDLEDYDKSDIKDLVKAQKAELKIFFTAPGGKTPGQRGTGSRGTGTAGGTGGSEDDKKGSLGKRLAEQKKRANRGRQKRNNDDD